MIPVKIFGERNTGTNALKQLVEQNSGSVCLPGTEDELSPFLRRLSTSRFSSPRREQAIRDFVFLFRSPLHSWKHCATNFRDPHAFDGVIVLFVVRHPASWLRSLFSNPYHHVGSLPGSIATFLDTPWKTARRERLGGREFTPLDLFMTKLVLNLELASRLSDAGISNSFVRHEDLVLDQPSVFRAIQDLVSDPRPELIPLTAATKDSHRSIDELKDYYSEERWRESLKGLENKINRRVDWKTLERFGYEPV